MEHDRIDLLVTRDADHPAQAACAKRMPERRAQAIAGIDEHAFEPHAGTLDLVDLLDGNLRLLPRLHGILLPKVADVLHAAAVEPGPAESLDAASSNRALVLRAGFRVTGSR
jgi:hypothetical protein